MGLLAFGWVAAASAVTPPGSALERLEAVDPRLVATLDPVVRAGLARISPEQEDAIRDGGFDTMRVGALVESAATFYKAMGMQVSGAVDWEPEIFGERQVTILTKRL